VGVGAPHGFADRFRNRWFTDHEGEFLSLDYRAARDRIERGLSLAREVGLDVRGFIAPAWLLSAAAQRAARDCGFEYTNSYFRFTDLPRRSSRVVPSLVFGPGHLNEDLGVALQRPLARLLTHRPIVRVVLHPPCIDHAGRFERILSMIHTHLASGHRPVTYLELLTWLRLLDAPREEGPRAR
jgi:hypothetical protein